MEESGSPSQEQPPGQSRCIPSKRSQDMAGRQFWRREGMRELRGGQEVGRGP